MSDNVDHLLKAALRLPDDEQLQLVSALLAAVEEKGLLLATVEEKGLRPFDEAWLEEIRRRSAEYDAGAVQPIPWAQVKERARKKAT